MKVILLKDVAKIGKKYEVKNVADGHATNFLIPRGLVQIATESNVKTITLQKSRDEQEKKVQEDLILKNIKDLEGVNITVEEKANDKGHLFAGIHREEIVPLLKDQTRLDVLPEHIILEKPIKEVGEHEIEVHVQNVKAKFKLTVTAK
jgi:large subunit ribosomal protein L9